MALLLTHLAARESEGRALASEVLHLYREVHLIEQLSEQLAALLNLSSVGQSALGSGATAHPRHARRHSRHGKAEDGPLRSAASFGPASAAIRPLTHRREPGPLLPGSRFAASILERGIAEIVNDCASDPRALDSERNLKALICAPLRAGQRTVGIIALANTAEGASYSAANLKLLNTIALQTAAAIANSILCAEMVDAARARAAFAAELHAASTVQQLLLQSASRAHTRLSGGVRVPARQRGRRRLLLCVLRARRLSYCHCGRCLRKGPDRGHARGDDPWRPEPPRPRTIPGDILFGLNNALIAQGQLGFTTACCIRISLSGEYTLANAGHIAPYLSGLRTRYTAGAAARPGSGADV
jgi:GAF domain-containing protein